MSWLHSWKNHQGRFRQTIKGTRLYRLFGERILHGGLWRIDRESLAGGVALGLFIALTPTIPFQMIMATIAALAFNRFNLPVALAACWVTNPLTVIPIFRAEERLGRWLMQDALIFDELLAWSLGGEPGPWMLRAIHLGVGSLFCAAVAAAAGNLLVRALWDITHYRRPGAGE